MKILIVYAYPNQTGFSAAVLNAVQENLKASHQVKLLDLYQENFDPVLVFNEQQRRRDLATEASTANYREMLEWSEQLIFIFPIWWSGMPAILKGFIDRVFAKGFAYEYKGLLPVGLLKGRQAWVITSHDTPKPYARFMQQDYGRVLKRQVLGMCGIKPVKLTEIAYLRGSSNEKREKYLRKIAKMSQAL
ncbi:NAD(P)H-dependent oxidoreductase [Enterococcus sp. 669A]|uniref:NAD(P)H-dependent oxidoreductase n=1 Tax=Candidatus Enterococcus moelleringii TaxID=2815325 RepID=A0ABS3LEB6_9ENTE|nr:NAD(P)H-dependent oxidoreductase [Enterococcus sp. 669A]MBO1307970.1 NAD(P)H-dependent oxidoreductase [Enterococcus sp. 669A]